MARVRGRGNKSTEVKLAGLLRKSGIKGWRRHLHLPGTPDFAFPKLRLAIYVDGCFWHGCPTHATSPKTNSEFWRQKLSRNVTRDRLVTRTLKQNGWKVLRIWEHELENSQKVIRRLIKAIAGSPSSVERKFAIAKKKEIHREPPSLGTKRLRHIRPSP
jgi:DNA mismatch endonuclease (patch repair protein)